MDAAFDRRVARPEKGETRSLMGVEMDDHFGYIYIYIYIYMVRGE